MADPQADAASHERFSRTDVDPGPRRGREGHRGQDLALIGVFAALMAVVHFAPPIPVGNFGVPITLGTFAVGLAGLVLGPRRAFVAIALWLALGLLGLPLFSGLRGGMGILSSPSAGYVIAYPLAGLLTGVFAVWVVRKSAPKRWVPLFFITGCIASLLTIRVLGIAGMALVLNVTLGEAALMDLAFWPGDVTKALLAALVAVVVHRAYPSILARR